MAGNNTTHYETLGVSKMASQDEIKKVFRELSMKFHPDLNKEHSCGEKFKAIANAHSILSSPIERKNYDNMLAEDSLWKRGMGNRRRHPRGRPPKPTGHVVMETLSNPRYFVAGVAAFGGVALLGSLLGGLSSKRPEYHEEALVEAWKNPTTGRFEQPAPWDKEYQRIQPKLTKVPREKVWKRHI